MSELFYFFITNLENEELLKKEVEMFFPELRLSYSRSCFLTFKGPASIKDKVQSRQWYFSKRVGISLEKCNMEKLEASLQANCQRPYQQVHVYNANETQYKSTDLPRIPSSFSPIDNALILDVIKIRTDEFWFGEHSVVFDQHYLAGGDPDIELPETAASRAYLKWAEAFEIFPELHEYKGLVVELGSAPGGGTEFLTKEGFKVIALDPGLMEFKNCTHLHMAVQEVRAEHFTSKELVQGLFVDMNLSPVQSSNETMRVARYFPNLHFVIINLKMTKLELMDSIEKIKRKFKDLGFPKQDIIQLPSHKKETMLIVRKNSFGKDQRPL